MNHERRAEILWGHLQREGVKGNKEQEIFEIVTALIDGAADAIETRDRLNAEFEARQRALDKRSWGEVEA
jgi:hypothetical protein